MRMLWMGLLLVSVLSACSSPARRPYGQQSLPAPTQAPVALSTDTAGPFVATLAPPAIVTARPEQPGGFEYPSVAEVLADLKTRDDVFIEVLQGWIIIREADGLTNWSFPPPDHPAYPAVAKRVLYRDQDGWHLKMDVLCEAVPAACDEFVSYFEAINGPMYQYIEQHQ
jgi:hypothetical protein